MNDSKTKLHLVIAPDQVSELALRGIIENFILREGTDYGAVEVSHETKVKQLKKQISEGTIKIVFDPASESVSLINPRNLPRS